jgi:hypothetical protein
MNGLSMLTEVIEPRELLGTMASKRAFAGMFPVRNERIISVDSYVVPKVALRSRQEQAQMDGFSA